MRKILIDSKEKQRIAAYCNCSVQQVSRALRGVSESALSLQIRDEAIRRGGFKMKIRHVQSMPVDKAGIGKNDVTVL